MRNPWTGEKHAAFAHYAIPTLAGGAIGAGTGALLDDHNRGRGALIGGITGGALGLSMGPDISRMADEAAASRAAHRARMDAMDAAHARTMADIAEKRKAWEAGEPARAAAHAAKMEEAQRVIRETEDFIRQRNGEKITGPDIAGFRERMKQKNIKMAPPIEGFVQGKGVPPPDPKKLAAWRGYFQKHASAFRCRPYPGATR